MVKGLCLQERGENKLGATEFVDAQISGEHRVPVVYPLLRVFANQGVTNGSIFEDNHRLIFFRLSSNQTTEWWTSFKGPKEQKRFVAVNM